MREYLGVEKSFDVIHLDLNYANKDMAIFFIDGFIKDDIFLHIMSLLAELKEEDLEEHTLDRLLKRYIPYVELATERDRSEEHTSELQSRENLVCRLLLEKKEQKKTLL